MATISQIKKPCSDSLVLLPLFSNAISAGFPTPADDQLEDCIDLNRYLISQPASTFFMRFEGEPMLESGLQNGDLLIVDRSVEPTDSKIVVAAINGELVVRHLRKSRRQLRLLSENPSCPTICITKDTEFQIWGVVTYVIRTLHSTRRLQ
jgi:DNA polymerase V